MTRPTLLKIICGLALLYGFMLASSWDMEIEANEEKGFWAEIARADKERAEKFRLGKAGQ